MWEELERWAADDFRSVNGQIESILHEAISRRRRQASPPAPLTGVPAAAEGDPSPATPAEGEEK